jgi:hypothetical protein
MDLSVVVVSWNTRVLLLDCLASVRDAWPPALLWPPNCSSWTMTPTTPARRRSGRGSRRHGSSKPAATWAMPAARTSLYGSLRAATSCSSTRTHAFTPAPYGPHRPRWTPTPNAAACGPTLLNGDGSLQPSWARFPDLRSEWSGRLDRSQGPSPEVMRDPARRARLMPCPVDWVGGACLLVRADAVARVGLWMRVFSCMARRWSGVTASSVAEAGVRCSFPRRP